MTRTYYRKPKYHRETPIVPFDCGIHFYKESGFLIEGKKLKTLLGVVHFYKGKVIGVDIKCESVSHVKIDGENITFAFN